MKKLKKYCDKQKRIVEKLLYKLFRYSFSEAVEVESRLVIELEQEFSKKIDLITWSEIKSNPDAPKKYAKYRTLKALIDVYLNINRVYTFTNDYEGEING